MHKIPYLFIVFNIASFRGVNKDPWCIFKPKKVEQFN